MCVLLIRLTNQAHPQPRRTRLRPGKTKRMKMQNNHTQNCKGSGCWVQRIVRRILGMAAVFPHLRWSKKLREMKTANLRVCVEQSLVVERGCLRYITNSLLQTAGLHRSIRSYLQSFVSRQCMRAMILCGEDDPVACPESRSLLKRVLSFFCFVCMSTKPKSAATMPNARTHTRRTQKR